MSTVNDNGSFGVNPIVSREGFTVDPKTGLPYTDNLYSKEVKALNDHRPINPDTGHPYTDDEIDSLPLSDRVHAMDFRSPAEHVSTVFEEYDELIVSDSGEILGTETVQRTVHTHSAPKSGVLRYSVGRNRAYAEDDKAIKREEAVQTYTQRLKQWRSKMTEYDTLVQEWIDDGGRFSGRKKPKKPVQPKNPLNKRTDDKVRPESIIFTGFECIARIMTEGYGCTPDQCANVQAAMQTMTVQEISGRPYTIHWSELSGSGEGYMLYNCAVPIGFFHIMMEALVKCTPRMEFTFDDKRCTGIQYTPEQGYYLDWCENVHRLFVHRRIDANEANSQGFDGKTLNRSSREQTYLVRDNRSTRGRLYSACDREDIVNRSFVIAFTPDLCTLVPVTDDGHGYVQCANVQTTIEQGQNAHTSVSMRTGRVRVRTTDGFWITFTDVQTGRLYVAFTESKRRADRMVACTGIIGCTDEDWTSGQFGPNAVKLISSSVLQFTSTFAYAGIVKFVVRRLFEMLYKRPVTKCALAWQDRRLRHSFGMDNGIPLYSIYKSNEHLFSDVEADIIEVELTPVDTLVEMYKHTDPHERRAEMFRNLRYMKNGTLVHCGRKMYKRMAEQLYRKMGKLIESTDV